MTTLLYHIKHLHSSYLYFSSSGEYFDLALKITCKTEAYCIKHRIHVSRERHCDPQESCLTGHKKCNDRFHYITDLHLLLIHGRQALSKVLKPPSRRS